MKINFKNIIATSLVFCLLLTGCGNDKGIDAPKLEELQSYGMENVKQTEKFKDYILTDYKISEGNIEYVFTGIDDENKVLTVICKNATFEEYNKSLPEVELSSTFINGMECRFIDRTVHYVPEGYVPDERVKKNVAKGTTEIKYGNSVEALLPIQKYYWYDNENSMEYIVESMGQYYSLEEMGEIVLNFMKKAEKE